jgi:hypothetical protein
LLARLALKLDVSPKHDRAQDQQRRRAHENEENQLATNGKPVAISPMKELLDD